MTMVTPAIVMEAGGGALDGHEHSNHDVEVEMRELPVAGHRRARKWWSAGIAAYLVLAGLLLVTLHSVDRAADGTGASILSLIGLGTQPNIAVLVLVASGILLTAASFYYVDRDIRALGKEESDIEFVWRTRGTRLDLVFVDDAERDRIIKSGTASRSRKKARVESLLDYRVRRVEQARLSAGAGVSAEEMRSIADRSSAQFGSFARYASSLLLLLAVLGTFAGVKTALPWLIQAVSSSNAATTALTQPLQAIAAAFGGNALALVGAIAVGLTSQGVAFGRQNMLERLEFVSAEYVYGNDTAASSDPMQAAIRALQGTTREFQSASGALLGIETGLSELGTQFRSAMDGLGDRLGEIADRQEAGLYDKTGATLEALQVRVGELTKSVEANAHAYAGLVASIRDRTEETRAAIGKMDEANRRLSTGIEGLLGAGQRAQETFVAAKSSFETMESAATRLADTGAQSSVAAQNLVQGVSTLQASASAMSQAMGSIAARLASADERADRAVAAVGADIAKRLDAATRAGSVAPSSKADVVRADSPEMLSALRQIAAGIDDLRSAPRAPLWMQFAIPGAAAAICVALSYGVIQYFHR